MKLLNYIKTKKWWFGIGGIVLVLIVLAIIPPKEELIAEAVVARDISQTILSTGQVVSDVDLPLSFSQGGTIENILVSVGDKVRAGQLLAHLNQSSELANVNKAQATLLKAQAKYDELVLGATSEEAEVARVALANAKSDLAQAKIQQDGLVSNSYRNLLSDNLEASIVGDFSDVPPTISGTYNGLVEGLYTIQVYQSGSGLRFAYDGLESGDNKADTAKLVPLGAKGLFIQFDEDATANRTWTVSVPNTKSTSYVTNLNSYESAKETRDITLLTKQSIVDARQADLNELLAAARPTELTLAEADILSAKGDVSSAYAKLEDVRIRAIGGGTITRVDGKKGQLVQAYESVLVLQDVDSLYLEANINEANINSVTIGMPVLVTFDAFGGEQEFNGEIIALDLGSTLVSGVVNYKLKAKLSDAVIGLRPGMTANMTVIIKSIPQAIAVPERSIIENEDGDFVTLLVDKKKVETPVTLGLAGDDGYVEVVSGVNVGDVVVLNKK